MLDYFGNITYVDNIRGSSTDATMFSHFLKTTVEKISPYEAHDIIEDIEHLKKKNDKYLEIKKKNEEEIRHTKNMKDDSLIKNVIFNKDATIVFWCDGTKTVVKRNSADAYDAEKGLLACMAKKFYNGNGFNRALTKWCPPQEKVEDKKKKKKNTAKWSDADIEFAERVIENTKNAFCNIEGTLEEIETSKKYNNSISYDEMDKQWKEQTVKLRNLFKKGGKR